MFSAFYVWSKALGIANTDFAAGAPNADRRGDPPGSTTPTRTTTGRTTSWSTSSTRRPKVAERRRSASLANDWQISGVYRWTSGRPYAIGYSIPGIGSANLTGDDGNPDARVVLTCDPGSGSSSDPYKQIDTSCFAPPQPGSDGAESARFFLHAPPINNLDLSVSKAFAVGKGIRFEVRLDAFNALNHTQFTGVNSTVSFASLTDPTITNLPYDASGNFVRNNGFGTINGVAPPRTLQLVTRLTF